MEPVALPPRPATESQAVLGRWQFSLSGLLQSMILISIMAAIYGGMLRSVARNNPFATVVFLGLSLTAPVGLTMLWSGVRWVRQWWRTPRGEPRVVAHGADTSPPIPPAAAAPVRVPTGRTHC